MRTPEGDDNGSEEAGTLADGFGTVAGDDSGDTDTDFGQGSGDQDETSAALQGEGGDELLDDGETQVFLDPSDSYTDTDLDLTGDGLVDAADFHEAVTGFFDFTTEDDGTYDDYAADDGHDEVVDPIHDAPHDDGMFGLFDV
jgi:hypothetical protein